MGCFPCFGSTSDEELKYYGALGGNGGGVGRAAASSSSSSSAAGGGGRAEEAVVAPPRVARDHAGADKARAKGNAGSKKELSVLRDASGNVISAQTFTFRQLAAATKNFRDECFITEEGLGMI